MLKGMIQHISSALSARLSKIQIHKSRMVIGLIAVAVCSSVIAIAFEHQLSERIAVKTAVNSKRDRSLKDSHGEVSSLESLSAVPAVPQASPQFELLRSVIAGGGGTSENTDEGLRLDGTIGQQTAGTTSNDDNGQYSVTGGFWQAGEDAPATPTPTPPPTPTFIVNSLNDPGDGTCDATECTLREAINAANANAGPDVVGFSVTGTINLSGALPAITDDLAITGPGAAQLTVRRDSGGDYRIFTVSLNAPRVVTISGLTMSNGLASGDSPENIGGGIANLGSGRLNILNCVLSGNAASVGGAIANAAANFDPAALIHIQNTVLSDNTALEGGGIWNQGTLVADSSMISSNLAPGGCGGGIASILTPGTAVTITNSTISSNSSSSRGGGICASFSTLTITGSTISGNFADSSSGGGISTEGADVTISNSTLWNNATRTVGGAISNFGPNPVTISNSTISGNNAAQGGGGIYSVSNPAPLFIGSTILALNTQGMTPSDVQGVITSQGYNVIGSINSTTITPATGDQIGVSAAQLDLGPLQNNGGPTQTIALGCGSVAIDKGINSNSLSTDQRGLSFVRTFDDPAINNAADGTDVGAFELQTQTACGGPTPTPTPTPGCVNVSVPAGLTALANTTLTVPVNASDTTGKGIISFDFTLSYNPGVLTPLATPFDQTNTLSSGFTITFNSSTPGQLVVSGFGTVPLSGMGTLLKLRFNVSGAAPACSSLNLTGFQFNEGNPCSVTANGQACVINGTISGNVTYGIVTGAAKPVPDATLSAVGSPNVNAASDANGAYLLSGLGGGNYTVTPNKTTDVNGITSFDAGLVAQHVVHLITLTANQQIAADTSNNGSISSFDAALIAQTAVGSPNPGIAGTWKFVPPSRGYASTTADNPNQDYEAILVGEVSGNWLPPGASPISPSASNQSPSTEAVISISLPHASAAHGATINIPITSGDLSSQNVISYDLDLVFDPDVLQPQASATSSANTLSNGMNITVNTSIAGHVRVSAFGALPLSGTGTLLNLHFTVVGAPGATTPLTAQSFLYNEGSPQVSTTNGDFSTAGPTAASATISGIIADATGARIAGAVINLSGSQSRRTISDANGNYSFNNVEIGSFYTITPSLANYHFSPANRSFSVLGNQTDAEFTANMDASQSANAVDTAEYFVRQQYLDFLGREPDQAGLDFWAGQLDQCGTDGACLRAKRIGVSAAFFQSVEFQESGSFVYRLYQSALGRQLSYAEFSAARSAVVGGPNLDASKTAFVDGFVQRADFVLRYQANTTGASFVDALLQTVQASTGTDLSAARVNLINRYTSGTSMNQSRSLVLRDLTENTALSAATYNPSFVLMEYFGYLRRDPDPSGYDFWLRTLNTAPVNFRGMVCAFVTSAEYQHRFSLVLSHTNGECGN